MSKPQLTKQRSGLIVVPGDPLGVIEEFLPGPGTYVEGSTIFSLAIGRALMDLMKKQVSVYPVTQAASIPMIGVTAVGQVSEVQRKQATVHLFKIGNKILSNYFTGLLHISDVSARYVETMSEICKAGDIIRVRVASDKNRIIHLSTNDKDLGVLSAFCSHCGHALTLKKFSLRCLECGSIEHRKTAQDYGMGEI